MRVIETLVNSILTHDHAGGPSDGLRNGIPPHQNMDSFLVICHMFCSEEVSSIGKELGTR
jgi:hypothetical protein